MGEKNTEYETSALASCLEVGKLLTSSLNLQEVLELIIVKISQLIEAQNWSLLLKDEKSGKLTFKIVIGVEKELIKGIQMARGEGIASYVAETGKPMVLPDVQNEPKFDRKVDEITGFKTKSIICIPLQTHGKILGVFEIVNVKNISYFESRYLPILTILADYAAIAIENSQHCDRIYQMSRTDEYTGLHNARYLHQILDEMILEASYTDRTFAVVFVDIDNFKSVVDTAGHLLGSQMLKEIGQTISSCLFEQDILIKYGGDEYIIIFPDRGRQEVTALTEKTLQTIRETTYLASEAHPVNITASFGIAMYPEDARTKKELLMLADDIMYTIKRTTKDSVGGG